MVIASQRISIRGEQDHEVRLVYTGSAVDAAESMDANNQAVIQNAFVAHMRTRVRTHPMSVADADHLIREVRTHFIKLLLESFHLEDYPWIRHLTVVLATESWIGADSTLNHAQA